MDREVNKIESQIVDSQSTASPASSSPEATPTTPATPASATPIAPAVPVQSTQQPESTQAFTIEQSYNPKQAIETVEKDITKINYLLVGVVIFIAVSFLISMYTESMDRISDKTLYLKYDTLYQQYSDKNSQMSDEINQQKITIDDLQNQLQLLKASNPYLK